MPDPTLKTRKARYYRRHREELLKESYEKYHSKKELREQEVLAACLAINAAAEP